jgi:eukaryotic-like serine/threonine-protein kinase
MVVFRSDRDGDRAGDLYRRAFGIVSKDEILLKTEFNKFPADWSRDGRYVAYNGPGPGSANPNVNNVNDVWALPVTGNGKPLRLTDTPLFSEGFVQISPKGQWISYHSDESGRPEVYIQSFPETGAKQQVSTAGGVYARWSHDGQELFYIAPDGTMMSVPIKPARSSIEIGSPQPLFQTGLGGGTAGNLWQYDVSPDGRFLISVPSEDRFSSPITVILNWAAGLKKN